MKLTAANRPEEVRPWAINIIVAPCHAKGDSTIIAVSMNLMWATEA